VEDTERQHPPNREWAAIVADFERQIEAKRKEIAQLEELLADARVAAAVEQESRRAKTIEQAAAMLAHLEAKQK
jgi:hypothetical protein